MRSLLMLTWLGIGALLIAAYPKGATGEGNTASTSAPTASGGTEYSCTNCHSAGTTYGLSATIALYPTGTSNAVTTYTPGAVYDLKITAVTTGAPGGFGFQLTGIKDSNKAAAGTFSAPMTGTQLKTLSTRTYFEHSARLSSSSKVYTVKWTAPATGTGKVWFYANVLAANANGKESGDQTVKINASYAESSGVPVENEQPDALRNVNLFPNPAQAQLHFRTENPTLKQVTVFDIQGRIIARTVLNNEATLDVASWKAGLYLVRFETGTDQWVKTFIKP